MKTLENILQVLGSNKPFLDVADNNNDIFTESGSEAYKKLIEIIYAVGELTETDVNDIVEEIDSIANEDY
jgi:hypothetical protein